MYQTRTSKTRYALGDNRRLTFYAAVFNEVAAITERSPDGGVVTYKETIRPGAFAEALATDAEVIANVNHDPALTFAKRTTGELLLQEDPHGLFCSAWVPETDLGDRIIRGVQSGQITGCSFQFAPVRQRTVNGVVEVESVKLFDVCVALGTPPAYRGTEVHLRTRDKTRTVCVLYRLQKLKMAR